MQLGELSRRLSLRLWHKPGSPRFHSVSLLQCFFECALVILFAGALDTLETADLGGFL
jgi:hypothetical protein